MVVAARGELSDSKVVKLRPVKVGDTTLINDGQMPGIPEDQGAPPCSSAREMCSRMGPRDLFSPPPTGGGGRGEGGEEGAGSAVLALLARGAVHTRSGYTGVRRR